MMPFKVDLQLAERCLMRTDIDSKVKWQWMLVYISPHNVHARRACRVFVVSGGWREELQSNPRTPTHRTKTVGVQYYRDADTA